MIRIAFNFLINAAAVALTIYLLEGVRVDSAQTLLLITLVFALVNALIMPILKLLTLPIAFMTLGISTILINGFMVIVVSWLVPSFQVDNFGWALAFSLLLTVVSMVLGMFKMKKK